MNTRKTALTVLMQVLYQQRSLTDALQSQLPQLAKKSDQAFVQALCYGVCRYFYRLDFWLSALLESPIKDGEIKVLALIGLYQLAFMRVKSHAAVHETVNATPRKKGWAKSFINALLRRFLREQALLVLRAQSCATARFAHPQWMITQLENDWGIEIAHALLEANNQMPPMTLRVNLQKTTLQAYWQCLSNSGQTATILEGSTAALMLDNPVDVSELAYFEAGWVCVQDLSAQKAAELLDLQTGLRVLDLCCAPGGKMAHLLECQPDVECVGVDIDASRLQKTANNLQRLQLNATLIAGDARCCEDWWDGKPFDRILVDAPCSASGVIRRHPDIKLLRRPQDMAQLVTTQQALLDNAWRMLAKDGLLLYATCSVFKIENEWQITQFLSRHADAQALNFEVSTSQQGLQLLTGEQQGDGFFYARLKKRHDACF